VPVLVTLSDVWAREGEGPGGYEEVESLACLVRKDEGACMFGSVRFFTGRDGVSVTTLRNENGDPHG
jgi:hypothetical protein